MLARSSLRSGILVAALSALSFGLSAPAVAHLGFGVGPFTTAALLYAGALCSTWAMSGFSVRAPLALVRRHGARVLLIACLGAALGPAAFAWGLQQSGATSGSLLLNFEAIFTAILAWRVFGEPFGARFVAALAAMASGGAVLAIDAGRQTELHPLGLLAIVFATSCWALDNTLTRSLSEEPPFAVVAVKSALGAGLAFALARHLGEPTPRTPPQYALLLLVGALGYGLSLRLYLEAQGRMGAGRTASVFALAPFVGALAAWLFGERALGWGGALSVPFFALGAYLHLTERHQHAHLHEALEHAHAHRHDDGHHLHPHSPPVVGEHTHAHRHEPMEHSHDHAPDLHHQHEHEQEHEHEHEHEQEHEHER
ncbi:MAG TPA: DMT family transporter [Polyangiaceae bacterium]|nr:DMT family transporter [Polyangiaceae bacterium]